MNRRTRKDAIIEGLTEEQHRKVDGWLFDKGLTYGEVAEACGQEFGVKLSRSSVGRYYERQQRKELRRKQRELRERSRPVIPVLDRDEGYERLMGRVMERALECARWLEVERSPEDLREFLVWMKLLIAARRERTEEMRAGLERERYEIWAARKCLEHIILRGQENPETAMGRMELRNRLRSLRRFGFRPGVSLATREAWRWPL